ncbi:MAG: tetratricopeptide repeat protein [Patescibacteria group bacterium]
MQDENSEVIVEEIVEEVESPVLEVEDQEIELAVVPRRRYLTIFEKISNYLGMFAIFLLPVLFYPSSDLSIEVFKKFIFGFALITAIILGLLAKLEDGRFSLIKSRLIFSSFLLAVIYFLSSLASSDVSRSLFGFGYETGTFISVVIFFFAIVIGSTIFEREKNVRLFLQTLVGVGILAFVLKIFHLYFPGVGSLGGAFNLPNENLIGKWNDLGIYFSLSALISLCVLEFKTLVGYSRPLAKAGVVVSLLGMAIVNFSMSWYMIGIFALFILVYKIAFGAASGLSIWSKLMKPSVGVIIFALLFIFMGQADRPIGKIVSAFQESKKINTLEARPSFAATIDVTRAVFLKDPIFGSGPNSFESEWRISRPESVNETIFWNRDFSAGYGYIPTALATVGIAGLIAWIIFLLTYLVTGIRAVSLASVEGGAKAELMTLFISGLYLFVFATIYVPDNALLGVAFSLVGAFVGLLSYYGYYSKREYSIAGSSRYRFIAVIVLVLVILSGVTADYTYAKKFLATRNFQSAFYVANDRGNIEKAIGILDRAIALDDQDLYQRSRAELLIVRLNQILSDDSASADKLRSQFQDVLSRAIESANQAVKLDPKNQSNYIVLGRVYESIVSLKIEGAYEASKSAYDQSYNLAGKSPVVDLSLARLEFLKGNVKKAREHISKALTKKTNFTEAFYLLSQIEAKEGNLVKAITNAEQVVVLAPGDVGVIFQLGFLRYLNKDYKGAGAALERAVELNSDFSNARYFLGLSYSKLGMKDQAVAQFEKIKISNPDNTEVQKILANLYQNRPALEGLVEPEGSRTLPVKEDR